MMEEIVKLVTEWYQTNKREIPWRNDPTGYHIWLSEIMCQQTRIETVIPYYLRFIEALPTIEALALVEDEKLMKLWQGLGYYSRARNLKASAKQIVERYGGRFPKGYDEVLGLKGIGEYTAGAILSIAFQMPFAAVDGNVLRVLTRVFADESDIGLETTKKRYKTLIESTPRNHPGDFNQGLMDLGATICVPSGKPLCQSCPLALVCKAHSNLNELDYPKKEKRITRKQENYTVVILQKGQQILLHKRGPKGLLAGLYEPKNYAGILPIEQLEKLFPGSSITKINDADFTFTHKQWHMVGYKIEVEDYCLENEERWVSKQELQQEYSVPAAFREFMG